MSISNPNPIDKGRQGEDVARAHLMRRGYSILAANYHSPFGEIDIIARDGAYIVFVEVKYRKNTGHSLPREAVNPGKQRKIIKTALHYITENTIINEGFRFDVIEVTGTNTFTVTHIENAFSC